MTKTLTRRKLLTAGLTAAAGLGGLTAAAKIADAYGLIPPDSGGIWGPGETLTYATQRVIMARRSMAREFSRSDISKVVPVSGGQPLTDDYQESRRNGFADWRLRVDGLVERPSTFSLDDLKRMPSRSQITMQACEEGWSFIAEWTGVPLSHVLNLVGVSQAARFVVFSPFDDVWDSLDLADAYHPQTLLAYALNREELPADHGAPLRVRVSRQLGYKSVKYLRRIALVESLKTIGDGRGSSSPAAGYSWYAGI